MEEFAAWKRQHALGKECSRRLFELCNAVEAVSPGEEEFVEELPGRSAVIDVLSAVPTDVEFGVTYTQFDGTTLPVLMVYVEGGFSEAYLLSEEGLPLASFAGAEGILRMPLRLQPIGELIRLRIDDRPPIAVRIHSLPSPLLPFERTDVPDLELAVESLFNGQFLLARDRILDHARSVTSPLLRACAQSTVRFLEAYHEQLRFALSAPNVPENTGVLQALFLRRGRPCCCRVQCGPIPLDPLAEPVPSLEEGARLAAKLLAQVDEDDEVSAWEDDFFVVRADLGAEELSAERHGILRFAAALVACSSGTERAIPANLFALASLNAEGELVPLPSGVFQGLVQSAARELPGARLLVSSENAAECAAPEGIALVPVESLEDALAKALSEVPDDESTVDGLPLADPALLDEAFQLERAYRREEALAKVEEFLKRGECTPRQRLRALHLASTNLVHLGRPVDAAEVLAEATGLADRLHEEDALDPTPLVYLSLTQADVLVDLFEHHMALGVLERARSHAKNPELRAKVDGFQGYVLLHLHRSEEAAIHLRHALESPSRTDLPRFHCWRARAEGDAGRFSEALDHCEEGARIANEVGGAAEDANVAFLCLMRARLLLEAHEPAKAEEAASQGLDRVEGKGFLELHPGASLLRALGEAEIAQGKQEKGLRTLHRCTEFDPSTDFLRLVCGLGLLSALRYEIAGEADPHRLAERLASVRELVSTYEPAERRFAAQLAALELGPSEAVRAVEDILRALRY